MSDAPIPPQESGNISVIILICSYIFRVTTLSIGRRTKGLTTAGHFVLLCRRGLLGCSGDPCGVQGAIYIVRNYLYRSREKRIVETCVSNNQLYGPFGWYKVRFKMNAALLPLQSSSLNPTPKHLFYFSSPAALIFICTPRYKASN